MLTTPNLGLVIPNSDNDGFDELIYTAAFNRLDGLVPVKIGNVTVPGGGASSINFSALPTTFAHLELVCTFRTDRAASAVDIVGLQFNGDTSANYFTQYLYGNAAVVTALESTGFPGSIGELCLCPAATASSARFASCTVRIPYYAQTGDKFPMHAQWFHPQGGASGGFFAGISGIAYDIATGPIASIKLLSKNGANLVSGSRATLYGLP